MWARCTCLYLRRSEGCPLTRGTGDAPPISFSVAPKRKRAVHGHLRAKSRRCASVALRNTSLRLGEKKRRFGAKRHGVPYLLMIRGSQQETLGGRIGVSVGRGPSSSQSPYPSLSAYAESSLIPTLVLSPRKPLRWVFAGAPVLLKFSAVRPRRTAFVRRRVQDRFDLLLPAAAALPTSNRHSRYHPGSAERSGERGKRRWSNPTTTHERSTHAPKCGEALLCSLRLKRTR